MQLPSLENNLATFVSQQMIFFLLMMTRKTLGIGLIVSEKNILIKSMPKLRDWQRRLLDGKEGKANEKESRKIKATRSFMQDCRGSMKSIWHEQHVKKKRPSRPRSAGTRRGVLLLFMVAPLLAAQS